MIILKHYNHKVNERKELGLETYSDILKELVNLYKDGEITDTYLMERYKLLADEAEDAYVDRCFDKYCETNRSVLRDEFEDDLIDNGYAPHLVDEVDDGWHQRQRDSFCNEYYGKNSSFFTTTQQYDKLLKNFSLENKK